MLLLFSGAHAFASAYSQVFSLKASYLINAIIIILLYKKIRNAGEGAFESAFYAYCIGTLALYFLAFLRYKLAV